MSFKKQRSQSARSKALKLRIDAKRKKKKNVAFHFRSSTDEIFMPAMSSIDCCTTNDRVLDTLDRLIERHLFLESKIPQIPASDARARESK